MDLPSYLSSAPLALIALYSLAFLWSRPYQLGTKLWWSVVVLGLPGIGLWLFLEFAVPVLQPSSQGHRLPSKATKALGLDAPGLVFGYLAVVALLLGPIWLIGGLVSARRGELAWPHVAGGLTTTLLGAYLLARGRSQLEASLLPSEK
jgi:hypothetical protein